MNVKGSPIALHLDHGPDFETYKSCIDGGFTSVMIDASSMPFEENIEVIVLHGSSSVPQNYWYYS